MDGKTTSRSSSQHRGPSQPVQSSGSNVQHVSESKSGNPYAKFPQILNKDADEIVKYFHKVSLKEANVHWEEEEECDEAFSLEDEKKIKASYDPRQNPLVGRPPGQGEHGTGYKHLVLSGELTNPKRYINGLFWIRGVRTIHANGPNQQRRDIGQCPGSSQDNHPQLGAEVPMDQSK